MLQVARHPYLSLEPGVLRLGDTEFVVASAGAVTELRLEFIVAFLLLAQLLLEGRYPLLVAPEIVLIAAESP